MSIEVVVAEEVGVLVAPLAAWLSRERVDPLSKDFIVVPHIGLRDYLIEHLPPLMSKGGGGKILANVDFWLPRDFNQYSMGHIPTSVGMWNEDRLVWVIHSLLEADSTLVPGYEGVTRKLALAGKIASLFARYSLQRPEMVYSWAQGQMTDGRKPLSVSYEWQYHLWRRVRELLGESFAEFAMGVISNNDIPDSVQPLLGNISFFGLDYVSPLKAALIKKMASQSEVHIFALTVSLGLHRETNLISVDLVPDRAEIDPLVRISNTLLKSWARPAGEAAGLLKSIADRITYIEPEFPETLLGKVKENISSGAMSVAENLEFENKSDRSIQIHKCHGAVRQMEVVRDVVLHILNSEPDIHARDILVICPQLDRFEALIQPIGEKPVDGSAIRTAVLGASTGGDSIFDLLDTFLELCSGRMTASSVLVTLAQSGIRERFGFSIEALADVERWVRDMEIRWGLDVETRVNAGYPEESGQGTWVHGATRLVAGLLAPDDGRSFIGDDVVPFDDLGSSDYENVGNLWNFIALVRKVTLQTRAGLTHQEWADLIDATINDLFDVSSEVIADQMNSLHEFSQSMREVVIDNRASKVSIMDVRTALQRVAPGKRGRSSSWIDGVRFGTLTNLRSIKAKVVVILGLDRGALRQGGADGDDILEEHPRAGDRDPKLEDRVSILAALSSASDYFIVVCDGHDVSNNNEIPSVIALEELIDQFSLVANSSGLDLNSPLVIKHSRQLADVSNLSVPKPEEGDVAKKAGLLWNRPWTFDAAALEVLRRQDEGSADSLVELGDVLLPEIEEDDPIIGINKLKEPFVDPFKILVGERLGISLPEDEREVSDEIEIWPDPLGSWKLGTELLGEMTKGVGVDEWTKRSRSLGKLPPGKIGDLLVGELDALVQEMLPLLNEVKSDRSHRLVNFEVSGMTVADRIEVAGSIVLDVSLSKWGRHRRIVPWLKIAVLTCEFPDVAWEALVISRGSDFTTKETKEGVAVERFRIAGDNAETRRNSAREILEFAVRLRRNALRTFIPVFNRATWLWVDHSMTNIQKALARDLSGSYLSLLYPDVDYNLLLGENSTEFESDLPDAKFRAMRYAKKISELWNGGVEVLRSDEKTKSAKDTK